MPDSEKVIKGLEALDEAMHRNQCYACSHEFVDAAQEFGTNILRDAVDLINKQHQIIQQYHKADAFLAIHGWEWREKT